MIGKVKKLFLNPLFILFLLALILRIYKLGTFPYGFHVDEVKVAWESFSILKTGADDHGNKFGLYYNSFGDYRPTGIFYFTIPSVAVFGKNEFAARFPVALFGALTILPIYFLLNIISKKRILKTKFNTGHLGAFLLAISPWHIELSRATNEVVISTFFALFALFFFIKYIKEKNIKFVYLTIISIIFSYLLYHAIRFLAPPFFIAVYLFYSKEIKKKLERNLSLLCIFTTVLLTLFFSTTKEGMQRFDQVSIFKGVDTIYEIGRIQSENLKRTPFILLFDNKFVTFTKEFLTQYGSYFAGDFLIGTEGRPYRFTTPGTGLIGYIEAILLVFGLIEIAKGKKSFLPLLLLLIAPLPAAITIEDAPNVSRAFLMVPFLIMIEAYGFEKLFEFSKKYQQKIIAGTLILLFLNFSYFLYMYYNHSLMHTPFLKNFSVDSPTYRDIGAKDLALKLDGLSEKYDKIVVTGFPDSLYPWYAFFTDKDPAKFNKLVENNNNGEIDSGNIILSTYNCPTDIALTKFVDQKVLLIDSWVCNVGSYLTDSKIFVNSKVVDTITRPDGSVVYTLVERDVVPLTTLQHFAEQGKN